MAIRNRFLAFVYRLLLLCFAGWALWLLFQYRAMEDEWWRGFYYFDNQTLLAAFMVLVAEVIANGLGLGKKTNGVVPGVWSPIFLASLSFVLFGAGMYGIVCAAGGKAFFTADIKVMLFSKILFPAFMLGDYLLFGEKGTVRWKHPVFWELYPLFYFAFSLLVNWIFQQPWWAVEFFYSGTFHNSGDFLAGNGGWNGVVFCSMSAWLGYLLLAYIMVFLNNCYAGVYRKRKTSDFI